MKKFLSVLLALAVAFTFTFGSTMSAFADAPNTDQVKILEEAYSYAQNEVNASFDKAYEAAVKRTVVDTVTIEKASWDAQDVKAGLDKKLNELYLAQGKDYSGGSDTNYKTVATTIFAGLVGPKVDSETEVAKWIFENYGAKAALTQYKADLAELDKALDNVDYDLYSSNVNPTTGKTYLEEAQAKITAAKAELKAALKKDNGAAYVDETTVTTAYVTKRTAYENIIKKYVTEIKIGDTNVGTGKYSVNDVKTKTDEANTETTNKATAAAVKAKAQELYAADVTLTPANKAADDAWIAVINYLADAFVLKTCPENISNANVCIDAVAAINDLNSYASKYKAETDGNGNLVRDASDVDKIVKKATEEVYNTVLVSGTVDTAKIAKAKKDIADLTSEATKAAFEFAQAKRVAELEALKEATAKAETYYPAELEKYNAAVDVAIASVKAAAIGTDLSKITPDISEIAKASDVDDLLTTGVIGDAFDTKAKDITNTINYVKNYNKTVLDPTYITVNTLNDVKKALCTYYGENGIRTATEIKASSDEDFISTLPTRGQIKDAKTAAENAIKAIPTKVTAADKATVEAAYNAVEAYKDITGSDADITNKSDLLAAINALYDAVKSDLAVKAYQVNKSDKAALKALAAEYDALNVEVEEGLITEGMFSNKAAFDDTTVKNALTAIKTAEKNAVIAAINALPLNLTPADKAKVEAARAAYDAYVAEYTDATKNINAATDFDASLLKTLQNAEAAMAELAPAYDDQDAKADLLDMSRKLTIWRTSKTSIKVTAVGSVANIKDNGYTVKYSFYKKAPGATSYKLIKTTTSNKYTYTNLKKGTNKFQVKVKLYDADGKLVATKMTYYRAAKIK